MGTEAGCEKEMCVLWWEGIFREGREVCMCVMLEGGGEDEYRQGEGGAEAWGGEVYPGKGEGVGGLVVVVTVLVVWVMV